MAINIVDVMTPRISIKRHPGVGGQFLLHKVRRLRLCWSLISGSYAVLSRITSR